MRRSERRGVWLLAYTYAAMGFMLGVIATHFLPDTWVLVAGVVLTSAGAGAAHYAWMESRRTASTDRDAG